MILVTDKLAYLKTMVDLVKLKESESEQIFLFNNISWQQYENLLQSLEDNAGIRLKYCEENLAIMSPSRRHEFDKKIIAMLLETYFFEQEIKFYPLGSTTFKKENIKRGIEPDECYCLYNNKDIPDLAIEVIVTSGGINSLEIYKGIGVTEVWFWEKEKLAVYSLNNGEYTKVKQSQLLPNLDLDLFASYIGYDEPFSAVLEFKQKVKKS
ncbi:MAG: Uma2 family endonuclease [Crocosphaera sp.]